MKPVGKAVSVCGEIGIVGVDAVQGGYAVGVDIVVGKYYDAVNVASYLRLGVTRSGRSVEHHGTPIINTQRVPLALNVAAVADGVVHAPVGIGVTAS